MLKAQSCCGTPRQGWRRVPSQGCGCSTCSSHTPVPLEREQPLPAWRRSHISGEPWWDFSTSRALGRVSSPFPSLGVVGSRCRAAFGGLQRESAAVGMGLEHHLCAGSLRLPKISSYPGLRGRCSSSLPSLPQQQLLRFPVPFQDLLWDIAFPKV